MRRTTAVPRSPSGWASRRTVPTVSSQSGEGAPHSLGPGAARRRPPGVGGGRSPAAAALAAASGRSSRSRRTWSRRSPSVWCSAWRCRRCRPTCSVRFGRSRIGGGRHRRRGHGGVLRGGGPAGGAAGGGPGPRLQRRAAATVRELYSWPIVGDRLEEADAAGEVEEAIAELPARIDDETLADLGERLLGGAFSTVVVVIAAIGVLADGEVIVRRAPRRRAAVPPGPGRRDGPDRLPLLRQLLRRLAAGRRAQRPRRPHRRAAARRARSRPSRRSGRRSPTSSRRSAASSAARSSCCSPSPRARPRPSSPRVLFLGYQQFENNVVGPAIVGSAVNLTPPTTMLAALVGGAAAGVPGRPRRHPAARRGQGALPRQPGQAPAAAGTPRCERRLKARLDRVKQAAGELTDSDQGLTAAPPRAAARGQPDAHRGARRRVRS